MRPLSKSPSRRAEAPSGAPRNRVRASRPLKACLVALAGAVPALVIASSASAAGTAPGVDWTMGVLALAFASMLLVLSLLAGQLLDGLRKGAAIRDGRRGER